MMEIAAACQRVSRSSRFSVSSRARLPRREAWELHRRRLKRRLGPRILPRRVAPSCRRRCSRSGSPFPNHMDQRSGDLCPSCRPVISWSGTCRVPGAIFVRIVASKPRRTGRDSSWLACSAAMCSLACSQRSALREIPCASYSSATSRHIRSTRRSTSGSRKITRRMPCYTWVCTALSSGCQVARWAIPGTTAGAIHSLLTYRTSTSTPRIIRARVLWRSDAATER
mmetsp:Transcript_15001/g.37746  ORF Transcript_15001/g.37746 Transcript_15001/m.37746 type:complete len:226 (-) Transcript_15001:35-712(-)